MRFIKLRYKLFLILYIFWFVLNFNFRLDTIIIGFVVSSIVTMACFNVLYNDKGFFYRSFNIYRLLIYLIRLYFEIYKAALTYISNLMFKHYLPIVFKMELDLYDPFQIGIIANSITLTPGTITVDINDNVITVMSLAKPGTTPQELEKSIRNKFEKLLKEENRK